MISYCGGGNSSKSSGKLISATINLTDIPNTFIYDRDDTQHGTSEYE